ncbi:unnamed protein product [Caenorhabditis angaria]|uniref:Transcription initiation factor TFIID subunit 10 n=1 Tax=Caenorhabditis angaria TaxID=860376 RepID=A0A9P1IUW0_9PELO|nr:unnamed protein product [Caenorhabditis angaria]
MSYPDDNRQYYNPSEPSIQNLRSSIHRPLTTNQQQFVQQAIERPQQQNPDDTKEFVRQLGEYQPTIPDSVSMHFLKSCGIDGTDARVSRLIALSAQKQISDIILDAMQNARMKGLGQTKKGTKETKFTLTEELLDSVLVEYGIKNTRPPYHT